MNSLQKILKIGVSDLDAGLGVVLEEEEEGAVWVDKTASGVALNKRGGKALSFFNWVFKVSLLLQKYKITCFQQLPSFICRQGNISKNYFIDGFKEIIVAYTILFFIRTL
jgi:hypothetical protein